jgi:hypothetical protein
VASKLAKGAKKVSSKMTMLMAARNVQKRPPKSKASSVMQAAKKKG